MNTQQCQVNPLSGARPAASRLEISVARSRFGVLPIVGAQYRKGLRLKTSDKVSECCRHSNIFRRCASNFESRALSISSPPRGQLQGYGWAMHEPIATREGYERPESIDRLSQFGLVDAQWTGQIEPEGEVIRAQENGQ